MGSLLRKLAFLQRVPGTTTALPAQDGAGAPGEQEMSLFDHLRELRDRLIVCVVALVVTTLIGFFLTKPTIELLIALTPELLKLTTFNPTESINIYIEVDLLIGFILALPILTWQMIAFVVPSLYPHEKRIVYTLLPGSFLCFVAGAAFSFFLALPSTLHFLKSFESEIFQTQWRAGEYIDIVTQLLFWSGIIFQLPLILLVLSKLRLINYHYLAKYRKYAFLIAFVVAAVITPTPDPINMTIVATPIYLLYEIGAFLTRFA